MVTPTRQAVRAWQRIIRDFVLLFLGMYIVLHETMQTGEPRIALLGIALVMLGLPPVLRAYSSLNGERPDERRQSRDREED